MPNIFEKVINYLNQPLPGAPVQKGKVAAKPVPAPAPAPAPSTAAKPVDVQQKAPDIHADLRARELEIQQAQAKADLDQRQKLDEQRKQLDDLRHKYETEMAAQAQTHVDRPEWTYTVKPGDTLSGIAKQYYGNAGRWPEIFQANKDKIKNANLIYPGQVFVIPDK